MGKVLQNCTRTTQAVRRSIQHSQQSLRTLARRHGVVSKTGCLIVVEQFRCELRLTFNEAQHQLWGACRA
jgi:hypothetical protein